VDVHAQAVARAVHEPLTIPRGCNHVARGAIDLPPPHHVARLRDVITAAGYGERFVHRTGHSLGVNVHGDGVHMDDYETHDDRRLLPGTGFTIEPGIYLSRFGIRSEINVVVGATSAEVTGPIQRTLVRIGNR
jgi:Xaa-Pro aminopeptidase